MPNVYENKVAVLLLAGGRGRRAGSGLPKQYRELAGRSVLRHAIDCFVASPLVNTIRVVIHPDDLALYEKSIAGLRISPPINGGAERHLSALNGLESLVSDAPDIVLIHDAARPFVDGTLIERVVKGLAEAPGVIPALPVSDTLKRVDGSNNKILETIKREGIWRAQTPQGFIFDAILEAHRRRNSELPTDDAAVLEQVGMAVSVIEGDERNIKLTTSEDFLRGQRMLENRSTEVRVGSGFDVHRIGPGSSVILCGIEIVCDISLIGHSDADVALHALTDALLGTIGAGDIGEHFPPSDPQWKGAASHIFVETAINEIRQVGGKVRNVDLTIIGERPKVGPHREAMRTNVARLLGISSERVNVKATTTEGVGFTGRGEGLAAQAVVSLELPK